MSHKPAAPFVHLHVHTHYSLLDGANRIGELVQTAKDLAMPAVAITDHGNMFGVIEFYKAAAAAGVKPVVGMEAYIAPAHRQLREKDAHGESYYHLLLLALNNVGYQNLLKLASLGYTEGFYSKPRIDREVLAACHEGLICTSTCLGAEIPMALMRRDRKTAERIAEWYLSVFGPERFFVELQDHGIPEQKTINPELADIAKRLGVGLVATNDVHYLRHEDAEAHDILCCIQTKATQDADDRLKFATDQFYLKSPEEMRSLFPDCAEALDNTLRIADRCNVELDFTRRYTPVYRPPESVSPEEYLRTKVYEGARERYGEISDELRERIDYELEVIQSKGFAGYFLICWDFVHYARDRGIPCGARGSGCSSVVAYCLFLSQPDPLRYGLYFERFLDPDRDEMPDIDIDICQDGREEVLNYVRNKYGHVAQIITFGTLKARAAIRDVCRVVGVSLAEADRIAKLVPEELKMTLDKALGREPELKRLYEEDAQVRKVIDVGRRIEGLARHASVHAAGVVIADQPLDTLLPLYKAAGSDTIVTQFDGPTVEAVGLLKMDFLGLRTLSVLKLASDLVRQNHGVALDLEHLDLTDQSVYALFAAGQTRGMFQFESGGMRDVLMKMRPNRIEDLIAANALYRPGPMVNIDAYIARKHGEPWRTPHKIMDEVLAETFGIIVYQEQVARLVNLLGGIERKRAFRLAKAISKKNTSMIEREREPFIDGCVQHGLNRDTAEQIFNQILPFGEYAFNKAHSTGYALVAFQTAYLKAYYPLEFMAASLTYEMGDTATVVEYIEECRRLGIDVRPPDVNTSGVDFTPVRPQQSDAPPFIRFGLAAIKGVGERAVQAIIAARDAGGPFKDIFDFCERVDPAAVNRGTTEALIKAGAFDSTGAMRRALVLALDRAIQVGAEAQRDRQAGQMNMFDAFGPAPAADQDKTLSSEEWSEAEMLANEKAVLGFYVTRHPLAAHADWLERFATIDCAAMAEIGDGAEAVVGGIISRMRTTVTKTGRNAGAKLAVLTVEDLTGSIEAVVYSEELERYRELLGPDKPVFLVGRVDRRREEPSLKVSEVIAFDDGPARLAEMVVLGVSAARLGESPPGADDDMAAQSRGHAIRPQVLEQVRDACLRHPGDRPLFLRVRTPDRMTTLVRCPPELAVRPDERFRETVESLLGPNSVELIGPRRPNGPAKAPPVSSPAAPSDRPAPGDPAHGAKRTAFDAQPKNEELLTAAD